MIMIIVEMLAIDVTCTSVISNVILNPLYEPETLKHMSSTKNHEKPKKCSQAIIIAVSLKIQ